MNTSAKATICIIRLTAGKVDSNFFLFGGMTQSTICSSTLQMGDSANGIRLAFVYHSCTIRSHALTQHLVSKVGMFGSLRAITYCACVYTQTSYFTNRSGKFHSSAVQNAPPTSTCYRSQVRTAAVLKYSTETCLAAEKEARVLEREVQSATGRFFVTTSRVSPSPLSVVWLVVVV